jgi:predicted DNA-binding transcriptional regulator AlpA
MDHDPYLNQTDAAELFGVTTRAIYNWMKAGRLPEPEILPNGWKAWRQSTLRNLVKSQAGSARAA